MAKPRTTDLTLYWLPGSLVGLFVAGTLYASVGGADDVFLWFAVVLALVSLVPLVRLAVDAVQRRLEMDRVTDSLVDAREGDDTALGRLLARWSASEADVRAYVDARAWERQLWAHVATAFVVIGVGTSVLRSDLRHHGEEELPIGLLTSALVLCVGAQLWAYLASKSARARAEDGPLAVIVCEHGVLFAGDLTWWRGPRRLISARSWDRNAIVLESWYALYVPPPSRRNDYLGMQRNGPRVQQLNARLVLPVPEGSEGKADAAVRALRRVHGLQGRDS